MNDIRSILDPINFAKNDISFLKYQILKYLNKMMFKSVILTGYWTLPQFFREISANLGRLKLTEHRSLVVMYNVPNKTFFQLQIVTAKTQTRSAILRYWQNYKEEHFAITTVELFLHAKQVI